MYLVLAALASAARPIDDDDWGSDRQIEAENAFFQKIETILSEAAWEELTDYCLKATSDEAIDEALRQVGIER